MSDKEFLTSKELSERWRLSGQTLANWRAARTGPSFIRISNRVRYPIAAIIAFEQQQQQINQQPS